MRDTPPPAGPIVDGANAGTDGRRPVGLVIAGYLLGLLLPFVGLLVGLVVISRAGRFARLHGMAIMGFSVLVLAVGAAAGPLLVEEGFHAAFPGVYSSRVQSPQREAQIRSEVLANLRRQEVAIYARNHLRAPAPDASGTAP